jgi:hypothetical protein
VSPISGLDKRIPGTGVEEGAKGHLDGPRNGLITRLAASGGLKRGEKARIPLDPLTPGPRPAPRDTPTTGVPLHDPRSSTPKKEDLRPLVA